MTMPVRFPRRALLALCGAAVLAACSTGSKRPDPTPLETVTPTIAVRSVWTEQVGSVTFPLTVALTADSFTVASDGGTVLSLHADTGRTLWRAEVGAPIVAGVGSDGRFASVVTRNNELVTLEAGQVKWRQRLGLRVYTAPLVAGERVFVLASDRSVHAFDAIDGRRLWTFKRPAEALTLAQPGVLAAYQDTLLVGQGPRLVGLDPLNGTQRWDTVLATPRGTNEVERLADLVGPIARVGDVFCARAFQASVGCVSAERGSGIWARNLGGILAVSADSQYVVATDANDRVIAWQMLSGTPAWSVDRLLYRRLTAPLLHANTVVLGDLDGQVHWLSRADGKTLARVPTDGSAIAVPPVRVGATVLTVTQRGGLHAFRIE